MRQNNGKWAKSSKDKVKLFADLTKVFEPYPQELLIEYEAGIYEFLESPLQMDTPIQNITIKEVKNVI